MILVVAVPAQQGEADRLVPIGGGADIGHVDHGHETRGHQFVFAALVEAIFVPKSLRCFKSRHGIRVHHALMSDPQRQSPQRGTRMLAVRRTVTALILAMTAAGSGAADSRTVDAGSLPYCAGLRGIVAAAGGWPPFQPVSAWERVVVPGFEQPCGLRSHGIGWRFVWQSPRQFTARTTWRVWSPRPPPAWMRPSVCPMKPRVAAPDSERRPLRSRSSGRRPPEAPVRR